MIKYNLNNINDWNFGEDNIIKVYRNNAIVFYKFDSETQEFKVCYAVVADITQYTDREFEDVYDKATEKWYKLNNLNQYEEYGIYGEGRNITYYEGKLTIDDGYEYEWNGSSWANLGEVSGSSQTIKSPEYIERNASYSGYCSLLEYLTQDTKIIIKHKQTNAGGGRVIGDYNSNDSDDWRLFFYGSNLYYDYITQRIQTNKSMPMSAAEEWEVGNYYIKNTANDTYYISSTTQTFSSRPAPMYIYHSDGVGAGESGTDYGQIWYIKIYRGNTLVRDFIPWTNMNGNYGLYDKVENELVRTVGNMTASTTINDVEVGGGYEYPKYYSEKSEPLNDLTFNTMEDALDYAYNNCVYDGMKAIINGDRYYFDSSDENGWVKILEYYKVEDVTPNQASGWTISGSSTYNPDSSYYDDFDLQTTSTSNVTKIAKVTIYGYDHFTYYLRTTGFSNYCYATATNVDEVSTPPSTMSYNSSSAITNTYNWNKTPKSAVNLNNYRRVTYNNLDKTVEHTFYVYFYGRTYSSYVGNATILIPKEQTNENWEQVTFSASSNVASTQKNLYIDNNYSTSGGTQYWYYRWMVGLPAGSHTSQASYSSYDYCPNVTSSTFTSVAGEQRQVNFTYDGTSNKTLSFRLTDGSNVLTPSETVYFNMTYYNSCGVSSSSSNVTFPRSQSVKVGGRFRFANSSNRHYIYGYSPNISLNYDYYVDNYQSTFDITYTKLSDEAVTITYTTYDPNDSEIPEFKTDITWPYSGGTTSSTTLTSFDVPYTYPYEVSQTSDKFSADSQSYTANQAARTINFVLYPNNREFASVADLEAYQYAWEGMTAYVDDTKYKYANGEWVAQTHSLPDVPFSLNFNAKEYNVSTQTMPKTSGQLVDMDAVITGTVTDHSSNGYITLSINAGTQGAFLSGYQNYFNRTTSSPNLTIVARARANSSYCHLLANRYSNYNWMFRVYSNKLTLHGTGETGQIAISPTVAEIFSARVNSSSQVYYNNWSRSTSTSTQSFSYGSTNSDRSALFNGYAGFSSGEYFQGDFYWIYMSQNTLTDEQIQQVIDYNENL